LGGEAAWVIIFVETSKAFVPEPPDEHDGLYGITVRVSRREKRARKSKLLTLHKVGGQVYHRSIYPSEPILKGSG
jgi:hypothetical protein